MKVVRSFGLACRTCLAMAACWSVTAATSPAAVVISQADTYAMVSTAIDSSDLVQDFSSALSGIVTASLHGVTSTTTFSYLAQSDSATFSASFEHHREGPVHYQSDGILLVAFSTTVDATYAISGSFTNSAGASQYYAQLSPAVTGAADLFDNSQFSEIAPITFVLGDADGPFDQMTGSLTGSLMPGQTYAFAIGSLRMGVDHQEDGTGIGSVELRITPVPEPTSLALCLMGFLGLAAGGCRRRR